MYLKITKIDRIHFNSIHSAEIHAEQQNNPKTGDILKITYLNGKDVFYDGSEGLVQLMSDYEQVLYQIGTDQITRKEAYRIYQDKTGKSASYKSKGKTREKKEFTLWVESIFFTIISPKSERGETHDN